MADRVPRLPRRFNPYLHQLQGYYVGQDIYNVPKPVLVMDKAKMRRHCNSLSMAAEALGLGLRTHVKTHKVSRRVRSKLLVLLLMILVQTIEGAELQVNESKSIRLIVSTIAELEHLLPLINDYQYENRIVNVLYGVPLAQSSITRLAAISRKMAGAALSFLVDHPDQVDDLVKYCKLTANRPTVYLKVDTGYHRAGRPPSAMNKGNMIQRLLKMEERQTLAIIGLYSHSSLSYNDSTPDQALATLEAEIDGCMDALSNIAHLFRKGKRMIISVGASPQVTAVENLVQESSEMCPAADSLRTKMQFVTDGAVPGISCTIELHAGVYSVLDMQQLATNSRPNLGPYEDEIAVSVISEVISVYNDGEREQPEALLSVGVLGLGRESCPSYKGWGVLDRTTFPPGTMDDRRLIISRISQEHSIVTWDPDSKGNKTDPLPLTIGQCVRIFPNHACITGAMHGWYVVVDSTNTGRETQIIDVWPRASGW
ncbi:hypothetical protein PWT90_04507 [Aphanocladium album]|nr:hypothetical protein PWT90_04507 [Aphanocladium album]